MTITQETRAKRLALRCLGLLAITFVLGVGAVELAAAGQNTSAWWPAAGTAAVAVLSTPRRWWPAVAVALVFVTGLSNLAAGRSFELSLAFGFVNAVESVAVGVYLTHRRPLPRLTAVRDVSTLLVAAVLGAGIASIAAALAVALIEDGEFSGTALSVFSSHVSALLTILPLALAWRPEARSDGSPYRWLQPVVLGMLLVVVFAPENQLPVSFVIFPVLMWGAFVLSTRALAVELVLAATAVTTLTMFGGGPFAVSDWSELERRFVVQGFLWTFTASALFVSAARIEQLTSEARVRRREGLLRAGILGAPIAMLMLREDHRGRLTVLESNTRAVSALGSGVAPSGFGEPRALEPVDEPTREVLAAIAQSSGGKDAEPATVEIEYRDRTLELTIARMESADEDALIMIQIEDVTERRRQDRALRKALRDEREAAVALRAADRQREEFVAAVSHELRTPITSILGFVEVLLDDSDPDPQTRTHLEIIERNATRLGTLVEDILALTARAKARTTTCDVNSLVAEAVTDLRRSAQQSEVTLHYSEVPAVFVMAVRTDLERILINLLSNAIKFTPPGGSVAASVASGDGVVSIRIADTGAGIPPDQLTTVFERFERGEFAKENQIAGVGLGLSMVKELADRNDCEVWLESDGETGTTAVLQMARTSAPEFTT